VLCKAESSHYENVQSRQCSGWFAAVVLVKRPTVKSRLLLVLIMPAAAKHTHMLMLIVVLVMLQAVMNNKQNRCISKSVRESSNRRSRRCARTSELKATD